MMLNGRGEKVWRPLANPTRLQISAFMDRDPKGFGLVQRTRRLEDYADLEAHYHERPTLWVTPGEGWGKGYINLVEIPADKEIYDNIVAYWRPDDPLQVGQEHRFTYGLAWGDEPDQSLDVAPVLNTRIGNGWDKDAAGTIVAIDFGPHPALQNLAGIRHHISASRGGLTPGILQKNPYTGGARLSFRLDPGDEPLSELRAQLIRGEETISEVWLYRWTA